MTSTSTLLSAPNSRSASPPSWAPITSCPARERLADEAPDGGVVLAHTDEHCAQPPLDELAESPHTALAPESPTR